MADLEKIRAGLKELPAEDRSSAVMEVFAAAPDAGGLDATAKKDAIVDALTTTPAAGGLPDAVKKEAVVQALTGDGGDGGLPPDARKEAVVSGLKALPDDAQREAVRSILPRPGKGIWYLLIGGLLGIAGLGMTSAFVLTLQGKTTDAAWAVVTAVIGGLIGLIAPSPTGG